MKKTIQKTVVEIILFAALLFVAIMLDEVYRFFPFNNQFVNAQLFLLSICIYIGLYSYWIMSIYKRIMQSHVRTYLMSIGILIIFWVTIRAIKWIAFEFVIFEDRILWYLYYIPMILLALFFFFTSLCVGENEEYRLNRKWQLLYIPALLLIVLVLTNDIHGLAFDIDTLSHALGQDYSHGVVYYLVLLFILSMVLMSSYIILRKFCGSKIPKKAALWPSIVIVVTLLYNIMYIVQPSYGIGYYLDLTIFGCTMAIALLESFIKTGLIHSNMGHKQFFAMSDIKAQILNSKGDVVYICENALPLAKDDFEKLKNTQTASLDDDMLSHIAPINGGYVVWNSEVSQIQRMIKELKLLNDRLYKEVDLLTVENEQKSESARLQKLSDLHDIMLKEILPFSEKIQSKISKSSKTRSTELKQLLFETSMVSTYIKRKINLILTEQTEKCISTQEIKLCFLESFQLLRLYGKTCEMNIVKEYDMNLDMAMASFDLYQSIIEKTQYGFDAVYVTYNFDESSLLFAVQISGDIELSCDDLVTEIATLQNGEIRVADETDSYYVSLAVPK